MTEEKYKKLNNYLNDIFIYLEKKDLFLLENIYPMCELNFKFNTFIEKYELNNVQVENNLSFNEVYSLVREIIESINKNYLNDYDELIDKGILDFSYNNEYLDSHYSRINDKSIININRYFNYSDVRILIHEFIHYTNGSKSELLSINQYLLTEYLSIYFEMYAINFLINKKHISKKEIDYQGRLINIKEKCEQFDYYGLILLVYKYFGYIDKNNIELLNIDKEQFDEACLKVFNYFEKIENNYNSEIRFKNEFNLNELTSKQCLQISSDYRYILGTLFAFYTSKYSKLEDIVYLNDHINDPKYAYMSIYEILLSIGIDLNDEKFNEELFNTIDEYINKYDESVKNR